MKINWFSPLPPLRTEIAQHTMRVLPELCKLADVTLWTTSKADWDVPEGLADGIRFFEAGNAAWRELNRADVTFFQIGNNYEFHRDIWEVSRAYPGIVVLHDISLQHLFAAIYLYELHDRAGYRSVMCRYHGKSGLHAADELFDGHLAAEQLAEPYPLTGSAVENALGVVLHNSAAMCRKEFSSLPVACLRLPYQSHEFQFAPMIDKQIRLIAFGYIRPNRRLEPFLEAWAELAERERFRLDIYGQFWDDAQLRKTAKRLGLQKQVEIHGFVSEEALDEALCRAQLAVNLRYPSMGEASGSQLRIWDHGLPSLVTRTGWYATLDQETVCMVDPDNERADIQRYLASFAAAPQAFADMGKAGKALLEKQHHPAVYARELLAFAERIRHRRHHSAVLGLADRVGSEIGLFVEDRQAQQIAAQYAPRLTELAD